jgi:cation diffusion facilitator family transporter
MTAMSVDARDSRLPIRAAAISLGVGIAVLILKFAAYFWTGSVALYSDALESMVNVGAAAAALLAVWYGSRPPDHDHPYGHDKSEYVSAVIEGSLIVVAAVAIVHEAWPRLFNPRPADMTLLGVVFSIAASLVNALLAGFLIRTGKRHRSPALVADGRHVRTDVVTSAGVLLGLALGWVTGVWRLDAAVAILVAFHIVWVGWKLLRNSIGGLLDEGLAPGALAKLRAVLEREMEGALEIHALKTRAAGPRTFIEFHLVVPSGMTVDEAHRICDRLERAIEIHRPGAQPLIHIEPEHERLHAGIVATAPRETTTTAEREH